jgi:hypothetical protein
METAKLQDQRITDLNAKPTTAQAAKAELLGKEQQVEDVCDPQPSPSCFLLRDRLALLAELFSTRLRAVGHLSLLFPSSLSNSAARISLAVFWFNVPPLESDHHYSDALAAALRSGG